MIISIETPVFKGGWLQPCIESVLTQTSAQWRFSLYWDGGDEQSASILRDLERMGDPRVSVYFGENVGIARARRFLTDRSEGEFILPLDDDDVLPAHAVERFERCVRERPWSGVIRARRRFIDAEGHVVNQAPWFPFEPRHYQHGMVCDLSNHAQPYLISRAAYDGTEGWEGFEDFMFAGEDCDIFLKVEEAGGVELLDESLYYYRLNPDRASDDLTPEAAYEMWRRLADKSIERMGLSLERENDTVPFRYTRRPQAPLSLESIDFVVVEDPSGVSRDSAGVREALAALGVKARAIHVVRDQPSRSAARNEGFRRTERPWVCFLDAHSDIERGREIEALIGVAGANPMDLAAPHAVESCGVRWLPASLLLIRREVFLAVGGFDATHLDGDASEADFCLKALRRDFRIWPEIPKIGAPRLGPMDPDQEKFARLRDKWSGERGPRK